MIRAMALLIDCYNVLYTTMPTPLAGLDEAGLCVALGRWRGGGRIVVVCDGSVKPHGPEMSPAEGVELVYSGPGRSADDVIIAMIDADSAPRRLTVVSNDRAIQKAARRRRCRVMTCERLIGTLTARRASPTAQQRGRVTPTDPLSEDEVQRWLDHFGIDSNAEDCDRSDWPW